MAERRSAFRRAAVRRPLRRRSWPPVAAALAAAGWLLAAAPAAAAQAPWDEPFEVPAAALAAAAAEVPAGDVGIDVLFEEEVAVFDGDGRRTSRHRLIYRVNEEGALEGWSTVAAGWAPWHQARPEVRARVIAADGRELRLDPATLAEQPVATGDPSVFSDRRLLEGPLPGMAVGALVVEEQVVRDTSPFFAAGTAGSYFFGRGLPVAHERLVLDVPAGLPLRHETHLLAVEPRREESAGRVRWTWEVGPQEAREWGEEDVPGDVAVDPSVSYAVGGGWDEVGAAYARWVDERANGAALPEEVTAAVAAARGRRARVAAALDWLHREVRYVALALGEASIVPRAPAETLARQYGDCKDKATLLVAVLRAAGIAADVALLLTGPGPDVDPDLPGLGLFDHAIVHLPADPAAGEPELWIDATAPEARVGHLPSFDRGRLALVARAAGSELRRTPTAAAADNYFRLDRDVELADWGVGRVTDRSTMTGVYEMRWHASGGLDPDEESGAEVDEPPADDVGRPLVVRYPGEPAADGGTDLLGASYSMSMDLLTEDLPASLLAADAEEPRRHDLEVRDPFVNEVHLRVVPPSGFEPVDLPAPLQRAVGGARYERSVEVGADGAVTVRLRFDSGPSRLTPEEVAATRRGLAELAAEEQVTVAFESRGQVLLGDGRVVEAVAELRRVAAGTPRSAHHARLAHALIAAGLGEAARREARAAVALDPELSFAHQTLGFVLLHDLFGRERREGWERAESEAALRRALDLDPWDTTARYNLALLLEHDEHAVRYAAGARLDEAAAEYRRVRSDGLTAYDHNLLVVLWRTGRYDEVAALAAEETVVEAPWYTLAAAAAAEGVPAALRQAAAIGDAGGRRDALSGAARLLALARLYAAAGELTAATAQGAPDAATRLAQAAQLRRIVPHESLAVDTVTPRGALLRVLAALVLDDAAEIEAIVAAGRALGGLPDAEVAGLRRRFATLRRDAGDVDFALDALAASLEVQHNGAPAVGYRLRFDLQPGRSSVWYLAPSPRGLVLVASDGAPLASLAAQALRHLDAGDVAAARQWLDWARDASYPGAADEPWSGSPLAAFWHRGEGGDEAAVRRGATVLLATGPPAASVLPEVERAHAAASDPGERFGYERALVAGYRETGRWEDLAGLARRRLAEAPASDAAFIYLVEALEELGRDEELVAVAEARLARRPDDSLALRALYQSALLRGDHAAARRHLVAAAAGAGQRPNDFNELAWLAVLAGEPGDEAVDHAHRALRGEAPGADSYAALHTLATLLAELDRPLEAKDVILQALDVSSDGAPGSEDWYVLGRIAESYGETDAARAAYARVEKPEDARWLPASSWALAQRRLAALDGG